MTLGEAANIRHAVEADVKSSVDNGVIQSSLPRTMAWTTNREPLRRSFEHGVLAEPLSSPLATEYSHDHLPEDEHWTGRGRTLSRTPRHEDPFSRPKSARARTMIEVRAARIGKRVSRSSTFHEDPEHPTAILDDDLLEPCPHLSLCAPLSEVIALPTVVDRMDVEFSIELSASNGYSTMFRSSAQILPAEILEQIYYSLGPSDFHSARHTCRSWFLKSLERSLLLTMCARGGFAGSMQRELAVHHGQGLSSYSISNEWLLSKRLSRECALGPHWEGNGLKSNDETGSHSFIHATTIEFTGVDIQTDVPDSMGSVFTVSSCGNFLMTATGCLIYIYQLNQEGSVTFPGRKSPSLHPVASIICPARVLACSMDTSSSRYAIAILLDGRMGMVCDITSLKALNTRHASNATKAKREKQSPLLHRVTFNSSGDSDPPFVFSGIATTSHAEESSWQDSDTCPFPATTSSSRSGSISRGSVLAQSRHDKMPLEQEKIEPEFATAVPIESGPRSLYRNICSEDDPPRSVAICPQRRCVAFGCSTGIELHWVDALTGQDLNRWFPLTSPSDFLFFLPPRKHVDSPKKLRLISSAAKPCVKSAIMDKVLGPSPQVGSTFWQKLGWDLNSECRGPSQISTNRATESELDTPYARRRERGDSPNHFRAIPLNDGQHVLFTDPASGCICLGSDAPIGGPTKLIRKVWFDGPPGLSPILYAAGSDFSWGVRVVAAYGSGLEQRVWMFSVPWDIFTAGPEIPSTTSSSIKIKLKSTTDQNLEWQSWIDRSCANLGSNTKSVTSSGMSQNTSLWPVKIAGQEICRQNGLVDLAINSGPDIIIWTFANSGVATSWTLADGRPGRVRTSMVISDGTLREKDADGNIIMTNSQEQDSFVEPLVSYDGSFAPNEWFVSPDLSGSSCHAIAHQSLPQSAWSTMRGRYNFEHLAWTILECGTVNQTTHWSKPEVSRGKTDFIARIDVEIH